MSPKTNQQRIKDLEEEARLHVEALDSMREELNELGDIIRKWGDEVDVEGDEEMSLDERFENHASHINALRKAFEEHIDETGAHDAPAIARRRSDLRKAEVAAIRASKRNEN